MSAVQKVSHILMAHRFCRIAKQVLESDPWLSDNLEFVIEDSGIEWRVKGPDGIAYVFAIYQKNDEIFCLMDGTLAFNREENRLEVLSWIAENQLTLPLINRIGERPSNNGGREIAVQVWSLCDFINEKGFEYRVRTFGEFCRAILDKLERDFGLKSFYPKTGIQ